MNVKIISSMKPCPTLTPSVSTVAPMLPRIGKLLMLIGVQPYTIAEPAIAEKMK